MNTSQHLPPRWSHVEHSSFHSAADVRWHVQRLGAPDAADRVLLLHGTGASTHSFRGLMEAAADEFDVLAVDLPGHGFSSSLPPSRSDTHGVAAALGMLLEHLDFSPTILLGHSAGVAVALRGILDKVLPAVPTISVNGAPVALGGFAGRWFAPFARVLAERTLLARLIARRAHTRRAVAALLRATGTPYRFEDVTFYQHLMADPEHVGGALRMMAAWDLPALERDLSGVRSPVRLLVAPDDRTLPRDYLARVLAALPHATTRCLKAPGHLSHEIDSGPLIEEMRAFAAVRSRAEARPAPVLLAGVH